MVQIDIFDVSGRKVRQLLSRELLGGVHSVTWNGEDSRGSPVQTGIYYIRVRNGAQEETRRIVIAR